MAGDLNAKHVGCITRLITSRWKLLREYADEKSCLIFRPETSTGHRCGKGRAVPGVSDFLL